MVNQALRLTGRFSASKRIAVCILCLMVAACISSPPVSNLPPAPRFAPVPEPSAIDLPPYRLQIGDVLAIKLIKTPELNDEVTVRPDGRISTMLSEDVPAYGHTLSELKKDLRARYKSQLRDPQIAVLIKSFAPNKVYVTGEVAMPGEFISVGPYMTLLQAISRAGGIKNSARSNKIIIIRHGVDNAAQAFAANYTAAVSGAEPASDVQLAPYDVVYVPRSGVGDAYLYYQQYVQQFIPLSFGLSYQFGNNSTFFTR